MTEHQTEVIRYLMKHLDSLSTETAQQADVIINYRKFVEWLLTKEWYTLHLAEIRRFVETEILHNDKR